LFWLGLFVAVSIGFEWWHSRQSYSGVTIAGRLESSTAIYSGESALRLRLIEVNHVAANWVTGNFFSVQAPTFASCFSFAMPLKKQEVFPNTAWEWNGCTVDVSTGPVGSKPTYLLPRSHRDAESRFDCVRQIYPTFSSATDRYDRLDIVAPYWFILSLYLPSWLGLIVWRRRRYFRRWDQVEGGAGTLSEPAGSASQASIS